ncbi:MAG TPA: aminotransferase class V-fold PLP-dependent enzyme [Vicinamibacterales bacterium]|jgi:selenocysteine lyase/cysteine desulfurase
MSTGGEVREDFVRAWPEFGANGPVEALRRRDFGRLDANGHVYLDYTGAGLYAASQVDRHMNLLLADVMGNPHSANPTSQLSTGLVDRARRHVLSYFNAAAEEYGVIFTGNASHALKLIGESYPFEPGKRFVLTFDNHNSVNGIREFARSRHADFRYIPVVPPDLRIVASDVEAALDPGGQAAPGLFAYPAQSNFSGVQHDLGWIEKAQARGWDVLLDAAAFVPTNRLDLGRWHPDYVVLSFYKMFGHPTGVGALLARWPALAKLRRPWFAGGTITVASVGADRHHLAPGEPAFEDGTLNFGSLPAIDIGLDFIESVGVDTIHRRVQALTGWLIDALLALRHSTGRPLVAVYGPANTEDRGGTITLNFRDETGQFIDHQAIEARAADQRISIRTGCFCNPGAGELAMGLSPEEMSSCFIRLSDRITYDEFRRCIDGKSTGAVRVSLGIASNFADVRSFVEFARTFLA